MKVKEIKKWQQPKIGTLKFSKEEFFNNADKTIDENLRSKLKSKLQQDIQLTPIVRKKTKKKVTKRRKGLDSSKLNKEIRQLLMDGFSNILLEVRLEDDIIYQSRKNEGFDFVFKDRIANAALLMSKCQGESKSYDSSDWDSFKKSQKITKSEQLEIENYLNDNDLDNGDAILGEIQFGNWGLMYRDMFRLIKARESSNITGLIFITSVDNLKNYLSDGTVNFDRCSNMFSKHSNVLKEPIWLVGLDIENIRDNI